MKSRNKFWWQLPHKWLSKVALQNNRLTENRMLCNSSHYRAQAERLTTKTKLIHSPKSCFSKVSLKLDSKRAACSRPLNSTRSWYLTTCNQVPTRAQNRLAFTNQLAMTQWYLHILKYPSLTPSSHRSLVLLASSSPSSNCPHEYQPRTSPAFPTSLTLSSMLTTIASWVSVHRNNNKILKVKSKLHLLKDTYLSKSTTTVISLIPSTSNSLKTRKWVAASRAPWCSLRRTFCHIRDLSSRLTT